MDNGTSATDIITYVGIPLAVLGVLPILYSFIRAILTQRSICRTLKHHGLLDSAITRGSLMAGTVEVELPRCTITPLDRDLDAEYWKLNAQQASLLKGGSWSIFHWNRLVTGRQLYRCQFKEELRVPQADIDFEDLVAFLLDRGAVPDAKGWHMLKSIGLWTPTATALLKPPRNLPGTVLKVAPPEDSDGVLSLQLYWQSEWDLRNAASLPPFWMRLQQPKLGKAFFDKETEMLFSSDSRVSANEQADSKQADSATEENIKPLSREDTLVASSIAESNRPAPLSLITSIEDAKALVTTAPSDSVRFKTDGEQIRSVLFESHGILTGESRDICNFGGEYSSLWFVCAASVLGQSRESGIWNIAIPDNIVTFARRKSIPCGVMVILGMLSDEDVPPWASPPPTTTETPAEVHQRMQENMHAHRMENAMPPAQAAEARQVRMLRDSQRFHIQHQKRVRLQGEYQERRLVEAIQSPRLDNNTVAEANLAYLVREGIVPDHYTLLDLVHAVLYLMILDLSQAKLIVDILERWALWCQFGGMQKVQLTLLMENKVAFCYASALVAIIQQASSGSSNVSSDMLECIRLWKRVRLG
ncbi:hypothetical protein BGW36DRAFT_176886 [Talaromyces proteolyticus]|uniref:Uncharacterized protein n=1 Tax=Talaromyces proteolyticus TaxID=1131652 RepID=A0AAD4KVZ4_9EURO|nr:uncharacterized protein BGW36DRAFT_176886 [Talaromyces proteolyticus]KAH8697911.1 hypothetical protein BGW36DRAFT_176886 [Talaromyces proteolyticus]